MTALRPHPHRTRRAATVCPQMMPVASSACEDPLRGSASAVPDLTPTQGDPEGEVGNGSGK